MKAAREAGHRAYLSYDKLIVMNQQGMKSAYTFDLKVNNVNCLYNNFKEADWCGGQGPTGNSSHSGAFKMVVWNIEGLMSKLEDPEFITYLKAFSFFCLTETFVNKEDTSNLDNIFNDYTCFAAPAKKYGRCSGGVLCLIRTNILHFFQHWPTDHDNMIVFKVEGRFFGYHTDILLFSAYIHLVSSPYYNKKDNPDGIVMLEQTITNILSSNQYSILLCADLNSRTGSLNFSNDTDIHEIRQDLFDETRQSEDTIVNQFGRSLLSMCAILDLTIVNGTIVNSGNFTYISTHGNSIIDYISFSWAV